MRSPPHRARAKYLWLLLANLGGERLSPNRHAHIPRVHPNGCRWSGRRLGTSSRLRSKGRCIGSHLRPLGSRSSVMPGSRSLTGLGPRCTARK